MGRGAWSGPRQLPACKLGRLLGSFTPGDVLAPGRCGATLVVSPLHSGLMNHWFSHRVTCLCAQFEAVLQHGLKRSRGLALTAAAIKQAAGFSSKTETGTARPQVVAQRMLSFLSPFIFI